MKDDAVNSPAHYKAYPKEVKDIILETIGLDAYLGWCLGNEMKYRLRAGLKGSDKLKEDMDKAMWFRREYLEKKPENNETSTEVQDFYNNISKHWSGEWI